MRTQNYYSNAKLLLSGEYLVLRGAKALALPLKPGQSMEVKSQPKSKTTAELYWKSYEHDLLWFEMRISLPDCSLIESSDRLIADKLVHILKTSQSINPSFLEGYQDFFVESKLSFLKEWGFGSSSTLINNIAEWADIGPYHLLSQTFGGSGYDIACASAKQALLFSLLNHKPMVEPNNFNPQFKENLFFIYLDKKQSSADSIKDFNKMEKIPDEIISEASDLSVALSTADQLKEFQNLMFQHEKLISSLLRKKRIKEEMFPDFNGEIKSLGAWGGDFVMAATEMEFDEVNKYFNSKGLKTIFKYTDLAIGY